MADPGQELSSINFGSLIGGPLCAVIEAQTQAARSTADFIKTVGFDGDNNPIYVSFKYPKEVAPYQPAVTAHVEINNPGSGYTTAPTVTGPAGLTFTPTVADGKVTDITVTGTATATGAITIAAPNTTPQAGDVTATAVFVPAKAFQPAQFVDMKIDVPILTILPIPFIRVEEATVDFNAKINAMETRSDSTDFAISGNLEVKQRWPGGAAKLNVSCSYQKKTASGSSVERTYSMQVHVRASQDEMPAGMEKLLSLLEGAMKSTPLLPAPAH
jgi:hypothetical protein